MQPRWVRWTVIVLDATPAVVIDGKTVHSGGLPSSDQARAWLKPVEAGFLSRPTRYLFFTGKGGVGKTSIACATAVRLADQGARELLVSTDPASNVGQVFGLTVGAHLIDDVAERYLEGAEIEVDMAPTNVFDFSLSASHSNSKLRSTVLAETKTAVANIAASTKFTFTYKGSTTEVSSRSAIRRWSSTIFFTTFP